MITDKYRFDKETKEAIDTVEKIATNGRDGNFGIFDRQISPNDITRLKPGVRYIDKAFINNVQTKRLAFKIDGKLYFVKLALDVLADTPVGGGGGIPGESYIKELSGDSIAIVEAEHGLAMVSGVRVYNTATGELINVKETILGNNVTIESNIDLANYSIMIF